MQNQYYGIADAYYDNVIKHHGILGQKWGVRRFQNPDGSLTPAGRERYEKNTRRKLEKGFYLFGDKTYLNILHNVHDKDNTKMSVFIYSDKKKHTSEEIDELYNLIRDQKVQDAKDSISNKFGKINNSQPTMMIYRNQDEYSIGFGEQHFPHIEGKYGPGDYGEPHVYYKISNPGKSIRTVLERW
ncbi:MAG: hypothetical protein KBT27_06585 [Prevotellaceae bacterium]|nr:hypothetical protein [Candidatus Faecinaster equi]